MESPKPRKEHEWLQKLVGNWQVEGEATMEPGKPPEKYTVNETVRSLGGLWVMAESRGDIPGGGVHQSITTLGFDPRQEKFVGTFVSSMMEFLWIYKGGLDTSLKKLTLDTEGPGPTGEGTRLVPYQDIYEFVNDDYRVLRSMSKGEDGKWKEFMLAHYRRKK